MTTENKGQRSSFQDFLLPTVTDADKYDEPRAHLAKMKTDQWAEVQGRRPSDIFLVNPIRKEIKDWRASGYPGTSVVTYRLLQYWFIERSPSLQNSVGPLFYFAQREALETIIFLYEVKKLTDFFSLLDYLHLNDSIEKFEAVEINAERRVIRRNFEGDRWLIEQNVPTAAEKRFCLKMATGTGKTLVMAGAIVWSYLNSVGHADSLLAQNFLLIAPNLVVYDRMKRDFENGKIFEDYNLIPPSLQEKWKMRVTLSDETWRSKTSGQLFITNIQKLTPQPQKERSNPIREVIDLSISRREREQDRRVRILTELPSIMVINDEAHHLHDQNLLWSRTLTALNMSRIQSGNDALSAWLDFTATPRDEAGYTFPWVVSDFPLADAVECNITKIPIINHRVQSSQPESDEYSDASEAFRPWLEIALNIHRRQCDQFAKLSVQPLMFVMAESVKDARQIAAWFEKKADLRGKVITIYSKISSDADQTSQEELESARDIIRHADDPGSPYRVIVSVLMLREGWDVRNVTLAVGLRPFSSRSRILPEQAIGRGLRRMTQFPSHAPQILEVVGTEAFENFVQTLENEGLQVRKEESKSAHQAAIYVDTDKIAADIEIPVIRASLVQHSPKVEEVQWDSIDCTDLVAAASSSSTTVVERLHATLDVRLSKAELKPAISTDLSAHECLADVANLICRKAKLPGFFHRIYPLVDKFISGVFFEHHIAEGSEIRRDILRQVRFREQISSRLAKALTQLAVEESQIKLDSQNLRLRDTEPFMWSGPCVGSVKTIFNLVACTNKFEVDFSMFLERSDEVISFARLCERQTYFAIEYSMPGVGFRAYYPDFVVRLRRLDADEFYIIETKGLEDLSVAHKDQAAREWCETVSKLSGHSWLYVKVPYNYFYKRRPRSFAYLVKSLSKDNL